jgi:hypothetical protein
MIDWIKENRDSLIRNSFLLPILLVVIMSISHVVSWYDLGNPRSWAIYLSIAIEIFALASVSASSIKMSRGSIWFLFGLVTLIQIIGNIFFEYQDINPLDASFVSWMELIQPLFDDWSITDHRRLLATIQGGTLPLMSLTALHFYIKFSDLKLDKITESNITDDEIIKKGEDLKIKQVLKKASDAYEKRRSEMGEDVYQEMIKDEPTALANSQYVEQESRRKVSEITKDLIDSEESDEAARINAKIEEELKKVSEENNKIKDSKSENPAVSDTNKIIRDSRENTPIVLSKNVDPKTGRYTEKIIRRDGNS